jgi:hypothetical protein
MVVSAMNVSYAAGFAFHIHVLRQNKVTIGKPRSSITTKVTASPSKSEPRRPSTGVVLQRGGGRTTESMLDIVDLDPTFASAVGCVLKQTPCDFHAFALCFVIMTSPWLGRAHSLPHPCSTRRRRPSPAQHDSFAWLGVGKRWWG